MPVLVPLIPFRRRRTRARAAAAAPVVALTLVEASYAEGWYVRLKFDRAIDVTSADGAQVFVFDGPMSAMKYCGAGATTLVDPVTVEFSLVELEPFEGTGISMLATAATGIVAVDDGGTWAGDDVTLPYG